MDPASISSNRPLKKAHLAPPRSWTLLSSLKTVLQRPTQLTRALPGLCLLLALSARASAAEPPLPYTDTTSERALHNMQKLGAKDPRTLSAEDGIEWVRSRFAWVALLRLEGKDQEAADVFAGCGNTCAKLGSSSEWGALKKWGCARRPDSVPCQR